MASAGDPGLPVDWPPVPFANPVECDFRNSGETDNAIANYGPSTNGITEYTASNYNGDLKGRLLLAGFNGSAPIYEVILSADGKTATNCPSNPINNCNETAFAGFGSQPLDITAQGDLDIFPGTVWTAVYGPDTIYIHEPGDYDNVVIPNCVPDPSNDNVDNDSDGYTDFDEDQNGTALCSAGSQPDDLDDIVEFNGFKRSDLLDLDDDNDGVPDVNDAFARDPQNGFGSMSQVPLELDLFNQGSLGLGDVGFTGLMTNGSTDYLDQFIADPNDPDRIIFGGAVGVATVTTTDGDAYQGDNSQDNGFQFGVDVGTATGPYVVRSQINPPFFNNSAPGNFASHGIFLGTGDQDNYIKLVLSKGSGNASVSGFQVLMEVGGSTTSTEVDVPDVLNVTGLELIMKVDPSNGEVTPFYSLDGATPVQIGNSPFTASGNLLAAIQGTYTLPGTSTPSALAVGMISTATGPAPVFKASWDYFFVNPVVLPTVANPIDDIEAVIGSSVSSIDLNEVFNDDSPLTFEVVSTDDTVVDPSIADDNLALTIGQLGTATVTVTATDPENNTVTDEFTVAVIEQPSFELRINSGGAAFTDYQGNAWVSDVGAPYDPGGNAYIGKLGIAVVSNIENPTDGTVDNFLYETERSGPQGWTYDIAVPNGTYAIDFHFAEVYFGSATTPSGPGGAGQRVFDIIVEGQTLVDDLDINATVGPDTAMVQSYSGIVVADGSMTIVGTASTNQPKLSGMYIYSTGGGSGEIPIVLQPIADQTNVEGTEATFDVAATGGDGNLAYSISGQPAGIDVEPTNGDITGTIDTGAAANSPYTVTVTVDDSDGNSADAQSVTFEWTVLEPQAGTVLYRVNNGGPEITDPNGGPVWSEDQSAATANGSANTGTPSPYLDLTAPATDTTFGANFTGANTLTVPPALFNTERFSVTANPNNMKWDFPVPNGDYLVNLYFVETWTGAQDPGVRVFDVEIEGVLELDDFDIVAAFGWQTAGLESVATTVADGNLDIDFIKGVQNPAIKAIEIISLGTGGNTPPQIAFDPTTIDPVTEGDDVAFTVNLSDVDGDTIDPVTIEVTDGSSAVVPDTEYSFTETAPNTYAFSWTTASGDADSYTATVTASDGTDSSNAAINFVVNEPVAPGDVLYRINVGGPELAAADGSSPVWAQDNAAGPSTFRVSGSNNISGNPNSTFAIDLSDPSLANLTGVPEDLFRVERWDQLAAPNMKWELPVDNGVEVEVRLYFAEIFTGITGPGERVFDVEIEGVIQPGFDDIDPYSVGNGLNYAFVRTATVTSDGTIDIEFFHVTENPALKGIEIVTVTTTPTLATLNGTVTREGRTDHSGDVTVGLYQDGVPTPVYEFTTTTDASGNFSVTGINPDEYEVAVKADNTLQVVQLETLAVGDNSADFGEMPAGDANNDNLVSALDYTLLANSFNLADGDTGYEAGADFNGDGAVSALDYSLLAGNFNELGEVPSEN